MRYDVVEAVQRQERAQYGDLDLYELARIGLKKAVAELEETDEEIASAAALGPAQRQSLKSTLRN
jgi:hypothetical protein